MNNRKAIIQNEIAWDKCIFQVTNKLPFNSFDELDEKGREDFIRDKNAIEYSHILETLIKFRELFIK